MVNNNKKIIEKYSMLKLKVNNFQKLCRILSTTDEKYNRTIKDERKEIPKEEIKYIERLINLGTNELNIFIEKKYLEIKRKNSVDFQKALDDISEKKIKKQNMLTDLKIGKSYKVYKKVNNDEYKQLRPIKVLRIYEKFILVRNGQFRDTILKNDLVCGYIKVKELKA